MVCPISCCYSLFNFLLNGVDSIHHCSQVFECIYLFEQFLSCIYVGRLDCFTFVVSVWTSRCCCLSSDKKQLKSVQGRLKMCFNFRQQVLLLGYEAADTREYVTTDGRIVSWWLIENYVERRGHGQIEGIISAFDWRDRGEYEKTQRG
jgi:hypothetical protein